MITIKSIWFGSNVITTRVIFGLVFLNSITNAAWICWYLENVFSISKIFCWTKLSPSICLNWSTLFWIIGFLLGCARQNLSQKCPSLTKFLPFCVHIISGHPISKVTVTHKWFPSNQKCHPIWSTNNIQPSSQYSYRFQDFEVQLA